MLTEKRTILLVGDVSFESAEQIILQIRSYLQENAKEDIYLIIASTGGNLFAAFSLYDFIKASGASVVTIGLGEVSSAAIMVWLAATKGGPKATENTFFALHETTGGMNGSLKVSETETLYTHRAMRQDRYFEIMAKTTNKTFEEVKRLACRDTLFDVDMMVKSGFLHRKDIIKTSGS